MLEMTYDMKKAFFDQKAVQKAVGKETAKAVGKSLAIVRKQMRSRLRRRKNRSKPGQAPTVFSRNPSQSLKKILFAYDRQKETGVVGSVLLTSSKSATPLPKLMEFGGTVNVTIKANKRKKRPQRTIQAKVAPRPNAFPSLEIEAKKGSLLAPWANVVGG